MNLELVLQFSIRNFELNAQLAMTCKLPANFRSRQPPHKPRQLPSISECRAGSANKVLPIEDGRQKSLYASSESAGARNNLLSLAVVSIFALRLLGEMSDGNPSSVDSSCSIISALVREYVAILFQSRKNKYVLQYFLLLRNKYYWNVVYYIRIYSIFFLPQYISRYHCLIV